MPETLMISVSGVRGIVGTDLTPEMMARWAAAFGVWAKGDGGRGKGTAIVVGRDARTSGPMFVQAAEAGLASVGCDVISLGLTTTPTAQLAVTHHRAAGGLMFTASHNPIEWNGLKCIGSDGIFLDGAAGTRVRDLAEGRTLHRAAYDSLGGANEDVAAIERHIRAVLRLPGLGLARIHQRRFRVALDTARGSGGAIMPLLLQRLGAKVRGVNLETDGRFPRPPEPVPENLGELGRLVRRAKAHVGIAVDPDVDRLALVDETGTPIGEDYTLAFAVRAVLGGPAGRRAGGRVGSRPARPPARPPVVVCNLSTSLVVDDAARDCGAAVVRTPVGEVHVARQMVKLKAAVGGEGNGGVMHPALHAGRDAPVAAALVLALLARTGKTVSELVAAAPRYTIVKTKVERGTLKGQARNAERGLDHAYAELRRRFPDAAVDVQDGLRLAWPDRWLHVRPSNTEPIIRLIAEAPSGAQAERLIQEGRSVCAAS